MAFTVFPLVIVELPNALLNSAGYMGLACRRATALYQGRFISLVLATGPTIWESNIRARAFQKKPPLSHAILKSAIEFMVPTLSFAPVLTDLPLSVNAYSW